MSLTFDLGDRPALITGASGGLGAHFARTLAAHGAPVALAARRSDRLRDLASEIEAAGGRAHAVAMDVTDAASVAQAFAAAEEALGTVRVLVNNSGIATPGAAIDTREEDWDRVLDTNLKGAFLVAREGARRMIVAGASGSIINIASILSFRVGVGLASYAASKAGLKQLTCALALELARNRIRVNAIAPGYIETDMNREFFASAPGLAMIRRIPQRRIGQPADLDGVLLLLASDASEFMTGATLVVDGGHLVSGL
jgi:NAD(P)-dependent dehydrogenase (short-subunit alcohol dehydrogenase family)